MFGLKLIKASKLNKMLSDREQYGRIMGHDKAIADIVECLEKSDKVMLKPVTITGDYASIENCTFLMLGTEAGIKIRK